ncbi:MULTISPECIES: amidase [Thalassobaculum]|uniref:Aspartyl-tRNA(Asn)/glutamyl-tRNA(Gln) amidotransferase subunit A n=1 Tax=Thalassobaculum litoreum DSM 18839 TaxID=1123362 RepID=A0A8G2EXG1_9PROT|nr:MULTISPECIES: amidase [Thalassobaculum]SDF39306.1 aspartyl-tRNA(Asn)/glutamyl-tRNA(Gln) amidotransferase subunit A [Thalassobaculum litoreum DSM 18839]
MTFAPKTPIAEILTALDTGQITAAALLDTALERAKDASGEGARVFLSLMEDSARAEAVASDGLRKAGVPPRPLEGLPISVKDLFDVKGAVTTAGSKVLASEPPAEADAPVIARLRAAGAVLVGRTNMTEFAYSGLGINPHYGTPANAWDRASKRIPGGSSSGAAVSVTDGMATVGLGTDTGGSVRIPSGLCGLAGFKPTQSRVPIDGAVPLSTSLDSIGPLAPTMDCCVRVHQVLAGEPRRAIPALPVKGLRLAVPKEFVLDDLDEPTAAAFQAALSRISEAGATIVDLALPELLELPVVNAKGGFTAPESYALHERHILRDPDAFDPRVISRMRRASEQSAADYYSLVNARADIQARVAAKTSAFDAVLMPTTPRIAPPIEELAADDAVYGAVNMAMLRNCSVGNFLDRCAATIPVQDEGAAPVGLMIMGETLADDRILAISLGLETLFT